MSEKKYMKRVAVWLSLGAIIFSFYTLYTAKVAEFKVEAIETRLDHLDGAARMLIRSNEISRAGAGEHEVPAK